MATKSDQENDPNKQASELRNRVAGFCKNVMQALYISNRKFFEDHIKSDDLREWKLDADELAKSKRSAAGLIGSCLVHLNWLDRHYHFLKQFRSSISPNDLNDSSAKLLESLRRFFSASLEVSPEEKIRAITGSERQAFDEQLRELFDWRNLREVRADLNELPEKNEIDEIKPVWNSERRELSFNDIILCQFDTRAKNVRIVLGVFESENWPECIESPLRYPEAKKLKKRDISPNNLIAQQLADTRKSLMAKQSAVIFSIQENSFICWAINKEKKYNDKTQSKKTK